MTTRSITFTGGINPLIAFGLGFALVTAIWVLLGDLVAEQSAWIGLLTEVGKFAAIGGLIWLILRMEAVEVSALGFSRRHVLPALLAFGAFWLAMNVLGLGLALGFGNEWSISLIWFVPEVSSTAIDYGSLPGGWVLLIVLNFLVVGVIEEVAFRGYLQSKVIALLGAESRVHIGVGILVTTLVFGALHTPAAIVDSQGVSGIVASAALPTVTAIFFGVIYEVTQNLPFVALLHGFGNSWPLVIHWGDWSGTPLLLFWAGTAVIYLLVTGGYRYWAADTPVTPVVRREEAIARGRR
jgi:membrane protease YdiL (CAAX protease family)